VIIDDLDIIWFVIDPSETYAPPSIDPNAVLARAFAGQGFESVARQHSKVIEAGRVVKDLQPPYCLFVKRSPRRNRFAAIESSRFSIGERADRSDGYFFVRITSNIKRLESEIAQLACSASSLGLIDIPSGGQVGVLMSSRGGLPDKPPQRLQAAVAVPA
jgi:hypothetical protein